MEEKARKLARAYAAAYEETLNKYFDKEFAMAVAFSVVFAINTKPESDNCMMSAYTMSVLDAIREGKSEDDQGE